MNETHPAPLEWRELSGDDIYTIAHLENETRDQVQNLIGTTVLNNVIHGVFSETLTLARQIVMRQELFAQMWFEDQARVRGREAAPVPGLSSIKISVVPTSEWIRDHLASRPGLTQARVARSAGITTPEMSNARSGNKPTSPYVRSKIYEALMTIVWR